MTGRGLATLTMRICRLFVAGRPRVPPDRRNIDRATGSKISLRPREFTCPYWAVAAAWVTPTRLMPGSVLVNYLYGLGTTERSMPRHVGTLRGCIAIRAIPRPRRPGSIESRRWPSSSRISRSQRIGGASGKGIAWPGQTTPATAGPTCT